ncbi:hypothetical protein T12_8303 [Trichinella patagoniensis]|uniref:Uncharacterized protein n=1 Tax=Trichinella patagoniensis TaxID=990121 RepID=A0A0V1A5E0_9BILA|nr:hypothetical protein T12_8303 [Trichinella patagoniensis]
MYSVLSAGLLHSQNPMFRYIFLADFMLFIEKKIIGSTEIRTRIAGFKVQSASRYTMEPRFYFFNLNI